MTKARSLLAWLKGMFKRNNNGFLGSSSSACIASDIALEARGQTDKIREIFTQSWRQGPKKSSVPGQKDRYGGNPVGRL